MCMCMCMCMYAYNIMQFDHMWSYVSYGSTDQIHQAT